VVSGVAKVANAFTRSAASALGTTRELSFINLTGWLSVGIAIAGGVVGARWGLAGVIYGVALGWISRSIATFYVAARHLRLPRGEQSVEPAAAQ
jgi:Na+-driven multidrug efflux pump